MHIVLQYALYGEITTVLKFSVFFFHGNLLFVDSVSGSKALCMIVFVAHVIPKQLTISTCTSIKYISLQHKAILKISVIFLAY